MLAFRILTENKNHSEMKGFMMLYIKVSNEVFCDILPIAENREKNN